MKKKIVVYIFILFSTFLYINNAYSLVYIDINAPEFKRFPIAITTLINLNDSEKFLDADLENGTQTLSKDLELTGIFEILDPVMFLEDPEKKAFKKETISFDDWTIIGSEGLVKGAYRLREDDTLEVEMRLFDTYQGQLIIGKRYIGAKDDMERIMHRFANEILLTFTGERGMFGSKISYVQDVKGYKEILVMDYDGSNPIQLTRDYSMNISPAWAPDGLKISYTSYKRGNPDLIVNDFAKREIILLSKRRGLNLGAEWSHDGSKVALTISKGNNSDIYILNSETGKIERRLTDYWGIDVSPSWSPDDSKIVFTSDRAGNPNLYIVDLDDGEPKRLTFNGKYNSSPSWSPMGDKIAYCGMTKGGSFDIFTINVDGTDAEQLTSGSKNNENPSWSPDGRQLAFASNRKGSYDIFIMNVDGANIRQLTKTKGDASAPSWSPRLE
ncbi:Tol-Pal system beta propeller repeat protein TolB [Thermodesulfobacteriota bacterium]